MTKTFAGGGCNFDFLFNLAKGKDEQWIKQITCFARDFYSELDSHSSRYHLPFAFFDFVLLKHGVDVLDRKNLLKWMDGEVDKPSSSLVYVNPKDRHNLEEVNDMAEMIQKQLYQGPVYIKPFDFFNSCRYHDLKIERNGKEIIVSSSSIRDRREILKNTRDFPKTVNRDGKIYFEVSHKVGVRELLRNLFQVPKKLEKSSDLKAPLYQGRSWEIRSILQKVEGEVDLVGHFARVGSDDINTDISSGGFSDDAAHVLMRVYEDLHPEKSQNDVGLMVSDFFKKLNESAFSAFFAINRNSSREFLKYIVGVDGKNLEVTDLAVDLAVILDVENLTLKPVVIGATPYYGHAGFDECDPIGYQTMIKNQHHLKAVGRRFLMGLFE